MTGFAVFIVNKQNNDGIGAGLLFLFASAKFWAIEL